MHRRDYQPAVTIEILKSLLHPNERVVRLEVCFLSKSKRQLDAKPLGISNCGENYNHSSTCVA